MPNWILIAVICCIVIGFIVIAILDAKERERRLSRYWSRSCTGKEWRRRFPEVPKEDIRGFLELFVDGFAFSSSKRLKFSPDDKVYDVYRSLYPSLGGPDALEMVIFSKNLEDAYGIDVSQITNGNVITLGELFQIVKIPTRG